MPVAAELGLVDLAEGRVVLEVGTKGSDSEQDLLGQQRERLRHLAEMLQRWTSAGGAVVKRQAWHLGGRS